MINRRLFIVAICCFYGILNTSCGIFHPPNRENGYLTSHYYSCGPTALSRAIDLYSTKNGISLKRKIQPKELSIEIQDDRGFLDVTELLILFDKQAAEITWPSEIKKSLKARSITIREITNVNELDDDVAIILVRKKGTLDTYHWIVYPWDELKYYKDKTVFEQIYVLIPKS